MAACRDRRTPAGKRRLAGMNVVRVLGEKDDFGSAEAVAAEDSRMQQAGIASRLVRFDGGHELNAAVLKDLAR